MRVMVTGATGFIATQIVTDLIKAGHSVTCCVRNIEYAKCLFPNTQIIACDFIKDIDVAVWLERVKDIDVVINCVGILYHPNQKIIWSIHYKSACALFDACVAAGVKKIIQVSALGIEKSDIAYAKSKKAADDYLMSLPIPSIILRPSLVYGRGSYGGTSLFRGLAGLPLITPAPGKGMQEFQPIHLEDLTKAIVKLTELPSDEKLLLSAVSLNRVPLKMILQKMRAWLGFPKSLFVSIPLWIIRLGSLFGNLIPYSAINDTSFKMLNQNNVTSPEDTQKFHKIIGFIPRDFASGIYSQPSTVQDHWHARLFFVKPLLKSSIVFVWIFTAICSLFLFPRVESYSLLGQIGINPFWQPIVFYGSCLIDLALGLAMWFNFHIKKTCALQILVIIVYSLIITWKLPHLWVEPFGSILKNIPLVVSILVFLGLESDR